MEYYTYAFLREDGTPYYIGKGKGKRIYSRHRRIKPPTDMNRVVYLKQNLTDEEAIRHEIYMIDLYGRKDIGTGILRNGTDGGEGVSGRVFSLESKKKLSKSMKGKEFSEEHRKKLSEAAKRKIFTPEHRRKMNEGISNYDQSGEKNPNYGKKWWNNGVDTKMSVECPGDGWVRGRMDNRGVRWGIG